MADSTGEQSDATQPTTDGGLDQSMVDALMNGSSDETVTGGGGSTPDDTPDISQADIDVLLQAAGDKEAVDAPSADNTPTDDETSPADKAPVGDETAPADTRLDSLGRPFDEAAAEMQAAIDAERAQAAAAPDGPSGTSIDLPELDIPPDLNIDPKRVTMLNDVDLPVKIELGRTEMLVEDVLKLGEGSVVELDKLAGDPVDVYVNDRLVARGEVLVFNDNFCVRISEVVANDPHRVSA